MTEVQDFLKSVSFDATSLEELPYSELRSALREKRLIRVRGLFDRSVMRAIRQRIAASFDAANDRRHDTRDTDAVRRNFQKLQIGANSGVNSRRTLGRFLRVLYNPVFAPDIYGMRGHFVRLAEFRNRLVNLPPTYAIAGTQDGLWTCARIQQYPRGGGFMVPHRDMYSQVASVAAELEYYQVILLLSEKGSDYASGGAYIDLHRERILYEDEAHAGDVFVYDGRTIHGVADIDPLEPLDLATFSGRAAAFVSLFRHLEPGPKDYESLSREAARRYGLGEPEE